MIELEFDAPTKIRSANDRQHWAARAADTRAWREAAFYDARRQTGRPDSSVPSVVHVTLWMKGRRRRDPHNYVTTVCKPIVDGLVDAGWWPDDTPEWVSVPEPSIEHTTGRPAVTVTVIPRGKS